MSSIKLRLTSKFMIGVVVIVSFLTGSNAHSQDFDLLMNAVNDIEVNLKALVDRESKHRQNAIAELKSSMRNGNSQTDSRSRFSEFESLFSALRSEVNELALAAKANEQLGHDFVRLQSEIEALRAKFTNMGVSNSSIAKVESSDQLPIEDELVITGFFDITARYQGSSKDETQMDLGQAEIHIDHYWTNGKYVRITPELNSSGNVTFGPVFARFIVHEDNQSIIKRASVSAGKMNIPFGIALLENAGMDRKIPTRPKLIGLTHGPWADFGVQMDMHFDNADLVVYAVNGFASKLEVDSVMSLSLGIAQGEVINTTPAYAFGARFSLKSEQGIEVGTSFATGFNESDLNEMQIWGLDLQYAVSDFRLKGEYISHSLNRSIARSRNRGYYLEGGYLVGNLTFAGRYGSFKADGGDWGGRVALAASILVYETIDLKYETIFDDNRDDNFSSLQLISRF